jgi:hypothetical protein
MAVAALITWLITALGGFWMLSVWITRGGMSQQRTGTSRFPAPVILGHFLLAAAGLVLWIAYVAVRSRPLAWTAFAVLLPVAALGFVMLLRWLPGWRASRAVGAGAVPRGAPAGHGGHARPAAGRVATEAGRITTEAGDDAAERHLPVPVILAHGLFAVVTLTLVLLTAAGVH